LAALPAGGAARHQRGAKERARGGRWRHAGVVAAATSDHCRSSVRAPPSRTSSKRLQYPVGSGVWLRAAIGERAVRPGRSRSPLNAVSSWRLGLLITDFARLINSEIALLRGRQGAATHWERLVASGGTHEEIARPLDGGVVGHALGAKRVALEPLDPSPGDRRVRAGASPRADRATTRRRGCRPRAWGEARGRRTTQSLPLRSQTRAAA
jgi:hypothetical protein